MEQHTLTRLNNIAALYHPHRNICIYWSHIARHTLAISYKSCPSR